MSEVQEKPVLAACSYCGGEAKPYWNSRNTASLQHYVRCIKCGAEGPVRKTEAEAIAAWNRRHVCDDHAFCCNTCDHKCGIELIESEDEKWCNIARGMDNYWFLFCEKEPENQPEECKGCPHNKTESEASNEK